MKTSLLGQSAAAVAALLIWAPCAFADPPGPVKACALDTQLNAGLNLAEALRFGGVIRFDCPAGTTIRVTGRYSLRVSTLIEGGDVVTLDGQGSFGPMLTSSSTQNIILRRIKLRGFTQRPIAKPTPGSVSIGRIRGTVLVAFGNAELDRVTIENSDFPIEVHGIATVVDSVFSGNRSVRDLSASGTARIERTRFTGNSSAISISQGWIRSCVFNGQTAGAVSITSPTGPVEVRHSTFSGIRGKSALRVSQRSGGAGPQTVRLRANVFTDNDGGVEGGAITVFDTVKEAIARNAPQSVIALLSARPPAAFALSYNRFSRNRGNRGGAIVADLAHTLGMVSTADLFVGNVAGGDGGAVVSSGGPLRMSHALFKANRAGGSGAALSVATDGSATISNTLIAGNVGPNGTVNGNAVTLTNVTIADNLATGLVLSAGRAGNVLLSHNRPADCAGVPAGVFRGGGLQSDGSCPGVAVGEAFLDPFYVPGANSPALSAGDVGLCSGILVGGVDLPFQARQNPRSCALGAFEGPPLAKFSSKTDRQPVHADPKDEFSDEDGYQPPPQPTTGYTTTSRGTTTPRGTTYPTTTPGTPQQDSPRVHRWGHWWLHSWHRLVPRARESRPQGADGGPLSRVLAALAAEEASSVERVHVFAVRGNVPDEYYMDRVRPNRFRMWVNPRQGGAELIVVDDMQWARTGSGAAWLKTPSRDASSLLPSMADLFRNGLTAAAEKAGADGGRIVEGDIAWNNGSSCKGKLLLRIDAAGLPSLVRFEGTCNGQPFRFRQAFSFAAPVTIEPPQ